MVIKDSEFKSTNYLPDSAILGMPTFLNVILTNINMLDTNEIYN